MSTIEKKIWPDMFENDQGLPVDFRLADFALNDGDKIIFKEWGPEAKEYTGRQYSRTVKRVTTHESPTRYWTQKEMEKYGMHLIEWEESNG